MCDKTLRLSKKSYEKGFGEATDEEHVAFSNTM